jgi:hypothetical protein
VLQREEVLMTTFSSRSIETLIDLVEIKLSCLDIMDREDREEFKALQRSLSELQEYRKSQVPTRHSERGLASARQAVA